MSDQHVSGSVVPSTELEVERHFGGSLAKAIAEAESSGGPSALVRLPRHLEVTDTHVVGRGITVQGAGPRGTIIEPAGGFDGWVFTVDSAARSGEWKVSATTYNPLADRSGPEFRDFMIAAPDRTQRHHGIRVNRADDVLIDNVQIGNLRGTALQLGSDPDALDVGGVRESELRRLKIYGCGDEHGTPAFVYQNASQGRGDGTNHVYLHHARIVYNYGGTVIRNHHDKATLRRLIISDSQFHGRAHRSVGALADHDLISIEGAVSTVELHNCIVNGTGPAPYAIIRTKASLISGRRPQGLLITGMSAAESVGDIVAVDSLSDLFMTGRFATGSIDGAVLRVAAGAKLLCYDVRAVGGTVTPPDHAFVVDRAYANNGVITWGGRPVTVA